MRRVTPRPSPTITPPPADITPEAPIPTPTPTPAPHLTSIQVQQMVFQRVSACADQVSAARESPVRVVVTATYEAEGAHWAAEAISQEGSLAFGTWQVLDATGTLEPVDEVASAIAFGELGCTLPVAQLAKGPAAPRFLRPAPTPTPTPVPLVTSAEEAQLRVWVSIYNCYDHIPKVESFKAYRDSSQTWVVEGRSETTHYGLWGVEVMSGAISPLDEQARGIAFPCSRPPSAFLPATVTPDQAGLLVWVAVYDCFDPRPESKSFTVYAHIPQRWLVVEGRAETAFYGLWLVDATSGALTPWDRVARDTARRTECYRAP